MGSIFSKIIAGEIPCYKITEDEHHIAFLDAASYAALMEFSRTVALGLRKTIPCKRIGMTVIGLEVPHVHVHLVPLNAMEDATFGKKEQIDAEEMIALAKQIAASL